MKPRLTVAIPLYRPRRWAARILGNIRRLPSDARILLSEHTGDDDSTLELARACSDDPRVRLRVCDGRPGWREHLNALIAAADTEFFCILPQDDRIAPDYCRKLVLALDDCPRAGLAFGRIVAVDHPFPGWRWCMRRPPFALGRRPPWQEAVDLERRWNLGIPFRGVVRTCLLQPIPPTPDDRFADQVWVFGIALGSHLLEVPDALYFKQYYRGQTHRTWTALAGRERLEALEGQIRWRLAADPEAMAAARAAIRRPGSGWLRGLGKLESLLQLVRGLDREHRRGAVLAGVDRDVGAVSGRPDR